MSDIEKRFLSKVIVKGPNDCWEWQASRFSKGYGYFRMNKKNKRAHRVVWELTHGVDPGELCVLHNCHNPSCVCFAQ